MANKDNKITAIPLKIDNNNIQDIFKKYLSGNVVGVDVANHDVEGLLSSLPCPPPSLNETLPISYETTDNELRELRRQNKLLMEKVDELQKKNEFYENNYILKPTGSAAEYLISTAKKLENMQCDLPVSADERNKLQKNELKIYSKKFKLTVSKLMKCKRKSITWTCRRLTLLLYPSTEKRMCNSLAEMDDNLVKDIISFGRCLNPFDTGVTDRDIRNGISNVFSSSKYHKN